MAYPSVRSTSSGVITASNHYSHIITLPPTISEGDLLIVFLSAYPHELTYTVDTTLSSDNFFPYIYNNWSQLYGFFVSGIKYWDTTLTVLMAWAKGSSSDTLTVNSSYKLPSKLPRDTWEYIYAKPSYICYSVSNVKSESNWVTNPSDYLPGYRFRMYGDTSANWDLPSLFVTGVDDSDIREYLWIVTYAGPSNAIISAVPSGFSDLITAQGSVLVTQSTSLSSCITTTNSVSNLDPGVATATNADWCGVLMKLYPADNSSPSVIVTNPSVGVGTYVYNRENYVYVPPTNICEVSPDAMSFNSDGTEDGNPYQGYIQITSSSHWTASWIIGTYFTASSYTDDQGVTYVQIVCNGSNSSGGPYIDTLTVSCGGVNDTVTITQASS